MANWQETINLVDVFHNDDMAFEDRRDIIVRRLLDSRWLTNPNRRMGIDFVVTNLGQSEDYTEFNEWWNELYDYADSDLVWIATF